MKRGLPTWAKLAIAAGVLVILGAVGGPYAYIHFISPKAAKSVTFSVSLKETGATVAALGSIPVTFSDYSIPNPSIGGLVTTAGNGTLEFLLNFGKSSPRGRLP